MSHQPRFRTRTEPALPLSLRQLGEEIARLPRWHRERLEPVYKRVVDAFKMRTRVMQLAREALEQAKLEITLLRFDNEMTKKENEELRRQLDQ